MSESALNPGEFRFRREGSSYSHRLSSASSSWPQLRLPNGGKKTGRKLAASPPRTWATPLEALLVAERTALLSGQDDDFRMLVTIAYTGMRWDETIGLEREFFLPALINVEWQLQEIKGKFHRLPPKDDSDRSTSWDPFIPIDLPPFLAAMLADQAAAAPVGRCQCVGAHGGSGRYLYTGPNGGHLRRSNYARRIFRPACDGRYPARRASPASWSLWTMPRQRRCPRRKPGSGRMTSHQGRADAPRPPAQPQDVDGRGQDS